MAESADWDRLVLGETSWTKDLSTARTAAAGTIRVKCVSAFGAALLSGLDRERNLTKTSAASPRICRTRSLVSIDSHDRRILACVTCTIGRAAADLPMDAPRRPALLP